MERADTPSTERYVHGLVSIIVPLYRSESFILETLQSVLNQTYENFEVVVVDDGSPDNSAEVCRGIGDPRIRVFSRENSGPCRSRNFGISQARGEFIAFLDHDDEWMPTKLERHVEHLRSSPEVGLSFGPSQFMDVDGNPLSLFQVPKLLNITPRDVLCRNPVGNGSVPVVRRALFDEVSFEVEREDGSRELMFFDADSAGWEDVECWFRMSFMSKRKLEGIADCLTLYRLTPGGITSDAEKKQAACDRGLARARRYAPDFLRKHEAAARAYHLRTLARRLVQSHDAAGAVRFIHRTLRSYPWILIEDFRRTAVTLAAAYMLRILPKGVYGRLETAGLGVIGKSQSRAIDS